MNIALLTAGGVGNRMGQDIPKQFMTIDNIPVIIYTMQAFEPSSDRRHLRGVPQGMGSGTAGVCQPV